MMKAEEDNPEPRAVIELSIQQVAELAALLEQMVRIVHEASRDLLELAQECNTPAFRQWRIYEERFGIWHGEN
jgi:hypothetical protein